MIPSFNNEASKEAYLVCSKDYRMNSVRFLHYGYKISVFFLTLFSFLLVYNPQVFAISNLLRVSSKETVEIQEIKKEVSLEEIINNTFDSIDGEVTRRDLVKIVVTRQTSEEELDNCEEIPFADVDIDDPISKYICVAKNKGIIDGYEDNTFRGSDLVTIDSASKIILRGLNIIKEQVELGDYLNELTVRNAIPKSISCRQSSLSKQDAIEILFRIELDIRDRESTPISDLRECKDIYVSPMIDDTCKGEYYISRGYSNSPRHYGVDLPMKYGSDRSSCWISSVAMGEVIRVKRGNTGLGNHIVVQNDNGTQALYAHLSDELVVEQGQRVEFGQRIGVMGRSGNASVTHLHFSLSENWKNVIQYNNRIDPSHIISF